MLVEVVHRKGLLLLELFQRVLQRGLELVLQINLPMVQVRCQINLLMVQVHFRINHQKELELIVRFGQNHETRSIIIHICVRLQIIRRLTRCGPK